MTKQSAAKGRRPRRRPAKEFITFYPAWCKKCGICAALCPKNVLETGPTGNPVAARPEDCVRCRLCELRCPDFAISVAGPEGGEEEEA
ncbi:MAG: 4Fe-4S binding protein [Deltaproteobacteria bacterium]|nr:4Fe-4S binding protein [Deltaproteobacteria bacterium]